ncbi:glycosyltransferase [Chryseomicrobium imtechense]
MTNKKTLFLGGLFPKELYEDILINSKGPIQNAANKFQWNIINGLDENLERPVTIINQMFIGSFPRRYRKAKIKSSIFSHVNGHEDYNVGFINISILKQFLLSIYLKRIFRKFARENPNRKYNLIVYSLQPFFLSTIKYIKKYNNNFNVCMIVPDLPEYMSIDMEKKAIMKIYKSYQNLKIKKQIKHIDSFVFLTDQMNNYFGLEKPYIVIEGMVPLPNDSIKKPIEKDYLNLDCKNIVYTGTLTKKYGVLDLVEAFKKIKFTNYRLIICGDGETKQSIIESSITDRRIIYLGQIQYQEIEYIQENATLLVNPRTGLEDFTKYSFPSKNMEYLKSGRPVICHKLPGIPDEYDDYLHYFNSDNINNIAEDLVEICEKDEGILKNIGSNGKKFVEEEKNILIQTKKIVDLLEKTSENE